MDPTALLTLAFVGAVLGWLFWMHLASKRAVGRSVHHLREHFPAVDGKQPVLIYCYSPNCGPCRAMTPLMERLARETGRVHTFDITRDLETAQKMGIRATPTTLVIVAGEVRQVLIGAQPPHKLEALLETED